MPSRRPWLRMSEPKTAAWRTGRVCRATSCRPTDPRGRDGVRRRRALLGVRRAAIVIEIACASLRPRGTASQPFDAAPRPRLRDGFDAVGRLLRSDQLLVQRRGGRSRGAHRRRRRRAAAALRARGRRHRASCAVRGVTHVLYDGRSVMLHDVQGVSPPVRRVGGGAPGARGGAQGGRAGSAARAGAGARAHAGGRHRARGGAGRVGRPDGDGGRGVQGRRRAAGGARGGACALACERLAGDGAAGRARRAVLRSRRRCARRSGCAR